MGRRRGEVDGFACFLFPRLISVLARLKSVDVLIDGISGFELGVGGGGGGEDEFQRILSELSKDIIVKKGGG